MCYNLLFVRSFVRFPSISGAWTFHLRLLLILRELERQRRRPFALCTELSTIPAARSAIVQMKNDSTFGCECGRDVPAAVHNANSTISPITLIECQIQPNDYKFQRRKKRLRSFVYFGSAKMVMHIQDPSSSVHISFFGSEPLHSPAHRGHQFECLISCFSSDATRTDNIFHHRLRFHIYTPESPV